MKKKYKVIIENFSKEHKGTIILDNINLNLESGKIYGFVGHNGSGKSMLFKSICGFVKGTSGRIIVDGLEIRKDISFPKNTGILIEEPGFIPSLTGFKNLRLLGDIQGYLSDERIKESLYNVGLNPDDKRVFKKYSLGMRQRLGIAQSLMENPDLIILDEPMNSLDDEGIDKIRNLIINFKKNNKTVLLTSHNKEDIDILCDKVFKLKNGKLIEN